MLPNTCCQKHTLESNSKNEWLQRQVIRLPHLHADYCIDEEEHGDEQADVGQRFEGLHESPEENADGVALSKQLDEASGSKQLQETHVESVDRLA